MFKRAAFYDSSAQHVPFQAIKDGGGRGAPGADPNTFQRIIDGNQGDGVAVPEYSEQKDSSMTEVASQVVNIDIV